MLPTICRRAPRTVKPKVKKLAAALEVPREHAFPPFYACYVLRSLGTRPRGRKTYIGTTTDPVRRLRQHNGELSQGARKTARDRPWIMSLLVHGFPSRLHALQFEWALQHPWKSRHLAKHFPSLVGRMKLSRIVSVVRNMLANPSYRSWPLHITLLDKQASSAWKAAASSTPKLPEGCEIRTKTLRVSKSGSQDLSKAGFDITDSEFRDAIVKKESRLLALATSSTCSICKEPVNLAQSLDTTICPSDGCTSVAHIPCLGKDFASQSSTAPLLPRAGKCRECETTVLWGDVIRGCYHRLRHRTALADVEEDELEVDDEVEEAEDEPGSEALPVKKRSTRKIKKSTTKRKSTLTKRKTTDTKRKATATSRAKTTAKRTAKSTSGKKTPRKRIAKVTSPSKAESKKRGRVRKTDTAGEASSPTTPEPKKRGRSRKTDVVGRASPSAMAEPKKRGRPRKTETVVSVVVRAGGSRPGPKAGKPKRRLTA